ncbi:cupin-like domain-containing protein [Aquimarina longa]|uniref:cupin-like domain-containing protein n=1 Tax=Aquimarina longa TaxID=1080221 RepID=UPI0007840D1B|nr:cupin-like domain-containing protein [Aquimarina longa]
MEKLQSKIDELQLFEHITIVDHITRDIFYNDFVNKGKPVVIRNMTSDWNALNWDTEYFKSKENGIKVPIKMGKVKEGRREKMLLSTYIELLDKYEQDLKLGLNTEPLGYLHDIPFFYMFPEYLSDIAPFPKELFPKWYWPEWQNYIQFFMGATGSLTPLHFDTLLTNNLFFQVVGKKKFILIDINQKDDCYIEGWRWAKFDPQNPDYEEFPNAKGVKIMEAVLNPGDILYMPPGMLHQVHGLSKSISFNIDWHTPQSAKKGVGTLWKGAPRKNVYYNMLVYLGLRLRIPAKYIFPFYKSYLNYVS